MSEEIGTKALNMRSIEIDAIVVGENYRNAQDEQSIAELAQSILECGMLNPITVAPKGKKYEVICGHRRFAACKSIDMAKVTCYVLDRMPNDEQRAQLQLVENTQRSEVSVYDEATAIKAHMEKRSFDEVAQMLGKSKYYVQQRLKLLSLVPKGVEYLRAGRLSIVAALRLASLPTADQKDILSDRAEYDAGGMLAIPNYAFNRAEGDLKKAPFDKKDAALALKGYGVCAGCIHNSATAALFDDKEVCSFMKCYQHKADASFDATLQELLKDPSTVYCAYTYELSKETNALAKKHGITVLTNRSYEKCDKSTKGAVRAFVVQEGYGDTKRGDFIWIKRDAPTKTLAAKKKAAASEGAEITVTREDVTQEIERIKSTLTRRTEILEGKAVHSLRDVILNECTPQTFTEQHSSIYTYEMLAFVLHVLDKYANDADGFIERTLSHKTANAILRHLKEVEFVWINGVNAIADTESVFLARASLMTADDIRTLEWAFNSCVRLYMLADITVSEDCKPRTSKDALALVSMSALWCPEQLKSIAAETVKAANEMEQRATKRVAALSKQIEAQGEAKEPKQGKAKPKAAKKAPRARKGA